jgi:RNA methyltransferase, TrmH family
MTGPVEVVRSRGNTCLKRVGAVLAGREDLLLLEGERLVRDALAAGCPLELLLVGEQRIDLLSKFPAAEARVVQADLLDRASALKCSPGVLALAGRPPSRALSQLDLASDALLLVTCAVGDPGNLGALARSAEAAGAAALVTLGGARPFGDKALRGSMGSLLRLPVVESTEPEAVAQGLAQLGVRNIVARTRGGNPFSGFDWSGRIALWVGGETGELPAVCANFEGVSIPMGGEVESLNVTVAASLLLFAAGRAS